MRDNHWKRQPLAGPRRCAHRPGHRDRPGRKEPVRRRTPGAHHPPLMGALASNSTSRSVTTNTTSRLPSASPCSAMDSSIISRGNEEVGGPTEIWSRSPLAGEGEGMVGNLPARHQGTLPHLRWATSVSGLFPSVMILTIPWIIRKNTFPCSGAVQRKPVGCSTGRTWTISFV